MGLALSVQWKQSAIGCLRRHTNDRIPGFVGGAYVRGTIDRGDSLPALPEVYLGVATGI